jgi:hypothetical protein
MSGDWLEDGRLWWICWSSSPPVAIYIGAHGLGGKLLWETGGQGETGRKWWPAQEELAGNSGTGGNCVGRH